MADPFNKMKKLDAEHLERDMRLYLEALRAGKPLPDFDKAHRHLCKIAKANGMSKKGAQAWATLQLVEMKRIMDERLAG